MARPRHTTAATLLLCGALLAAVSGTGGCSCEDSERVPGGTGDGVAPWSESDDPLRICAGETLLLPIGNPAASPRIAGRCVPTSEEAPGCDDDDECGLRERCVCGRCSPPLCTNEDVSLCIPGEACAQTSFTNATVKRCLVECDPDAGDNGACAGSEVCAEQFDGTFACVGVCDGDDDCSLGERCNSGSCRLGSLCDSVETACVGTAVCAVQGVATELHGPAARLLDGGPLEGGGVELFFVRAGRIERARSSDGLRFAVSEAAAAEPTAAWEGSALASPDILTMEDGRVILVYEADDGAAIGARTSDDGGATWDLIPTPLLVAADSFEGTAVRAPTLAVWEGTLLLLYEGGDGDGIGAATAADLDPASAFVPMPDPILSLDDVEDPVLWRNMEAVGAPRALVEQGVVGPRRLRLWFTGLGIESEDAAFMGGIAPAVSNESIGYAESADPARGPFPLALYPFNPVFDRPVAAVLHQREDEAAVVRVGPGAYWMYFVARDQAGVTLDGLRLALHPRR